MQVDVFFGAAEVTSADITGRVVAVIDVLRASTTIATALANGARAVVPCVSSDDVIALSKSFAREDVLLAGERRMATIPGFDLGNSPREHTPEEVSGKTVLLTTTNGTQCLLATQGALEVVVAAFVNMSAILTLLRTAARGGADIALLCAGKERRFALEDAVCAGRLVRGISARGLEVQMNDGAVCAAFLDRRYGTRLDQLFAECEHGRALTEAGYADDLPLCAAVDSHPIIPVYADRKITKLGPERAR